MAMCYSSLVYTLSAGGKLNPENKYTLTEELNVKEIFKVRQAFSHQRKSDLSTLTFTRLPHRKCSKGLEPVKILL